MQEQDGKTEIITMLKAIKNSWHCQALSTTVKTLPQNFILGQCLPGTHPEGPKGLYSAGSESEIAHCPLTRGVLLVFIGKGWHWIGKRLLKGLQSCSGISWIQRLIKQCTGWTTSNESILPRQKGPAKAPVSSFPNGGTRDEGWKSTWRQLTIDTPASTANSDELPTFYGMFIKSFLS